MVLVAVDNEARYAKLHLIAKHMTSRRITQPST